MSMWGLVAIAAVAHTVETITGFGATVLSLALGAHLVPLEQLILALVVVGALQSVWLVARGWRAIAWRLLGTRVLPAAGAGLCGGALVRAHLAEAELRLALGLFIVVAAALELWRLRRGDLPRPPLARPLELTIYAAAGVVHGLFATGGPLVVLALSRVGLDKHGFRATLSTLWLLLNTTLIAIAWRRDAIDAASGGLLLYLVPGLVLGILIGERLHRRISPLGFRRLVQGCLLVAGGALLV